MTRREAWPLVDWLAPEDDDFPERNAEIVTVLNEIRSDLDRLNEDFGREYSEAAHLVGCLRAAIFGPHTGIAFDEGDPYGLEAGDDA